MPFTGLGVKEMDQLSPKHILVPWVIQKINNGTGASWIPGRPSHFKVYWRRVGSNSTPDQYVLCRDWAIHQGRYTEGGDPQISKWKDNLIKTFRKSKFIEEVVDMGEDRDPDYKVFKIVNFDLPSTCPDSTDDQVDVTVDDNLDGDQAQVIEDFNCDLLLESPPPASESTQVDSMSSFELNSFLTDTSEGSLPGSMHATQEQPIVDQAAYNISLAPATRERNDHMRIAVKYCSSTVKQVVVTNPRGCHVYYSDMADHDDACRQGVTAFGQERAVELFGEDGAESIRLPEFGVPPDGRYGRSVEVTTKKGKERLANMSRGLRITCDDGSIYVTRYCTAHIQYMSQDTRGVPAHLSRGKDDGNTPNSPVKIFDIEHFMCLVKEYHDSHPPHPYAYLACAQEFCTDLRIQLVVASEKAIEALRQVQTDYGRGPEHASFEYLQQIEGKTLNSNTDNRDNDAAIALSTRLAAMDLN